MAEGKGAGGEKVLLIKEILFRAEYIIFIVIACSTNWKKLYELVWLTKLFMFTIKLRLCFHVFIC